MAIFAVTALKIPLTASMMVSAWQRNSQLGDSQVRPLQRWKTATRPSRLHDVDVDIAE